MPKEKAFKYIKPRCPKCNSQNTRVDEKKSQLKCQYCGYQGHWIQFFEGEKEREEVQKLFRKGGLEGRKYRKKPKRSAQAYYQEHRVQRLEYGSSYYQKNRTQRLDYGENYYRAHQRQAKEYYQIHRDKLLAYSKVHLRIYLKTEKGKALFLASCHRRRALLASCKINDLTTDEMRLLLDTAQVCAICGKLFDETDSKKKKTIDHIIPVSKNGNHTLSNIQIAHGSCNSKKGNRSYTSLQLVSA